MKKFKIIVSKNQKKYTIFIESETENQAKQDVHDEWYSILGIEEIENNNENSNFFHFSAIDKNMKVKTWKIVWVDIFKTYYNLRKNLNYNVISIYSDKDKNLSIDQKDKILKDLKEEYKIHNNVKWYENVNKKVEKKEEKQYYLKKELEDTNILINFILKKLEDTIIWKTWIELDILKKEKLNTIHNSIIKFKQTTNVAKLKEIWEQALLKIWELEAKQIEANKSATNEKLLKDTNSALKKLWSTYKIIPKNRDYILILKNKINDIKTNLLKKINNKENIVDKTTHSYIKNLLFLKKYKEKLRKNTSSIIKNILIICLNKQKREKLFIRRKVIKQNIILLTAREKGVWVSFKFIKKLINKTLNKIFKTIMFFKNIFLIVILLISGLFIIIFNINTYYNIVNININWIFYISILILIYFSLSVSKNIYYLLINFTILSFITTFWIINF